VGTYPKGRSVKIILDWINPWKPTDPLPKFITANFVNVSNLEKISKFRSGAGHNYSDEYEAPDRSMKHYFVPLPQYRETQGTDHSLRVYSPVAGTVVKIKDDIWNTTLGLGSHQLHIIPDGYNMFEVRLFHINNLDTLPITDWQHLHPEDWVTLLGAPSFQFFLPVIFR
jgi:hypothetical protein